MNTNIEQRVLRLEKQNRQLRLCAIPLFIVVGAILAGGTKDAIPDELVARKLRIVDEAGRNVAGISYNNGGAGLALADENGIVRVSLHSQNGAPSLALYDSLGNEPLTVLGVNGDQSSLMFVNVDGEVVVRMVANSREAGMGIYSQRGVNQTWLGSDAGGGYLKIADANGKSRILAGLIGGAPGLALYDTTGEPVNGLLAP